MDFNVGVIEDSTFFESYLPSKLEEHEGNIVLGLISGNAACGAITAHPDEERGIYVIDSIFVAESVRRQGGGTLLLDTLLEELRMDEEPKPVQISLIAADEDADALYEFLLNRGLAESESRRAVYLIPEEDFRMYEENPLAEENRVTRRLRKQAERAMENEDEELLLDLISEEEKAFVEKAFPDAENLYHSFIMF